LLLDGVGCPKCNIQIRMLKQVSDMSYYRAEVSEGYPFFVMLIYYGVLLMFLGCQLYSEIIYDMYGISIILCYGKYCFPFFFFLFFCDGNVIILFI